MDPVCHNCKGKQSATMSSMWSLSWCQISPRSYLICAIILPYSVTSCTTTALYYWITYPSTFYLMREVWLKTEKRRTLRMGSSRSKKFTYNTVSRSPTYMLIINLKHYRQKCLILASPSISCPRRNMYPRLNGSIGPPRNMSDIPEQPCLSD